MKAARSKRSMGSKSRKTEERSRVKLSEKVTDILELPKEIVLNVPKITMIGNTSLIIENYKGVIEYESCIIRINTAKGSIKITGKGLTIKEITSEDIMVEGTVLALEFIE